MATEKNIRDELLKQNGTGAQEMQELRDKILARDEARVARMKKLTIITWGVIVFGLVVAFIVNPMLRSGVFISLMWGLITIAAVFTISLYVRSRALTMRQIQARLAGIEEQLRKIADKS